MTPLSFSPSTETLWHDVLERADMQTPFYTYSWHKNWFETIGKTWTPYILLHSRNVLLPLAVKDNRAVLSGGEEVSDYMDAIGKQDEFALAWKAAISYLEKAGIKTLRLPNVPQDSKTLSYFRSISDDDHITISKEDTTPRVTLPETWEAYVSSLGRKYRHELRRKVRKFEREFPDMKIHESKNISHDIKSLFDLMIHNSQKQEFLTTEMKTFFSGIATTCSSCVHILSLQNNETVISSILYFKCGKTLFLYNSGFDKHEFSGAGFYLKSQSIKHAIDQSVTMYNFLQGNERYKYELGGKDFFVYTIQVNINN